MFASNGFELALGKKLEEAGNHDVLFVCSGMRVQEQWNDQISRLLHKFKSRKTILGDLCTGAYILARAGLSYGYPATIHWENVDSLREMKPEVITTEELFELDRDSYNVSLIDERQLRRDKLS